MPTKQSTATTAESAKENNQIGANRADASTTITFHSIFKSLTGYNIHTFHSYRDFTNWLHRPVDASALGVFRMLFGVAMLIDIAEERGGSQLDVRFGEAQHCHFPLINSIVAASFPVMGCVYLLMWLGALGIAIGYRFRCSCLAYLCPYWYIFLLDKPAWNNHSYLFGLVGILLLFSDANRYCSLDSYMDTVSPNTVPYWNYFLIKFQFFILYMYAGLKKLTTEWLSGYAMSSLSRHWVFTPFRSILSAELTDLLIVHWFTAVFDFAIPFLMTWKKSRPLATPFMLSFHLMNSRLFVIGMFPWVCLAEVPFFYNFNWPRRVSTCRGFEFLKGFSVDKPNQLKITQTSKSAQGTSKQCSNKLLEPSRRWSKHAKWQPSDSHLSKIRSAFIIIYCAAQLFLPFSHFITKGYNNWTDGLYGYSWNMMVHTYDTVLTSIKIVDNSNGKVHFLNPYAFTEYDRWTKYADMALQYAKCIESNISDDYTRDPKASPLSSANISIYFDIWCSMNGRFQQRVFDPRVDLLKAEWSPFKRTTWSLPLLNELNHLRPKLKSISSEVLAWNNYSDVIFVADFPGLTLDNYISPDLTNVTLTILEGNVHYKSADEEEAYFLTSGRRFALKSGKMHHVTTIGLKASCYLYTYINKTMVEHDLNIDELHKEHKQILPLWKEFKDRIRNYRNFLRHIGNCILYLLYNVPIPMDIRERA